MSNVCTFEVLKFILFIDNPQAYVQSPKDFGEDHPFILKHPGPVLNYTLSITKHQPLGGLDIVDH